MCAVQITEFGGPEVLHVVDLPEPATAGAAAGDVIDAVGGVQHVLRGRLENQVVGDRTQEGAAEDMVTLRLDPEKHECRADRDAATAQFVGS